MSRRLETIRDAARPRMFGRAMLSGPAGAGKTRTGLSIATVLAEGADKPVLVIDTERESALTYADSFTFKHLPWRPPFDPTELVETLAGVGDDYAVVMIDSLSHFWRGEGGTLDIADGRIGGWKTARPVQERLVQSILTVQAHVLLCVRSKMDYLVEGGSGSKQTVTKLGLAPIQDDTLVYEVNVAFDLDLEHRLSVVKSRSEAVPVGRMYPAGHEGKAAADYAAWLAGGVPPAAKVDVDAILAQFDGIASKDDRKDVKQAFVQRWGMPASITADKAPDAAKWLAETIAGLATPTATAPEASPEATERPIPASGPETTPDPADNPSRGAGGVDARSAAATAHVRTLDAAALLAELNRRDLTAPRDRDGQRMVLVAALAEDPGWAPDAGTLA